MKLGTMKAALPGSLAQADRVFCYAANLGWDAAAALAPLGERAEVHDDLTATSPRRAARRVPPARRAFLFPRCSRDTGPLWHSANSAP